MKSRYISTFAASGFALFAQPAMGGEPVVPAPEPSPAVERGWEFGFDIYGWAPEIQATLSSGLDLEVDFDDLLDDLDMVLMAGLSAKNGLWTLGSDVLYMDVSGGASGTIGGDAASAKVDLKAWIVTPTLSYRALEGDWGSLEVLAGARYLYMKEKTDLSICTPLGTASSQSETSKDAWAGVVGVRGDVKLSERWFLPFYADIGTGDPDLTWQVFGGVGYRFKHFELVAGYRYLDWELDSKGLISSLDINGPMIGAKFTF